MKLEFYKTLVGLSALTLHNGRTNLNCYKSKVYIKLPLVPRIYIFMLMHRISSRIFTFRTFNTSLLTYFVSINTVQWRREQLHKDKKDGDHETLQQVTRVQESYGVRHGHDYRILNYRFVRLGRRIPA